METETGGSGCWCREDRGCSKTHPDTPLPNPAPELRAAGRWWAQERWGTQCPHRALTQKPQGGEGPASPPISTHSEPYPKPTSMSAQQDTHPCHPRGLGLVQVPRAAPVTLCVSVPGEAGQVYLFPLLLPLGIVPVRFQGPRHWPVGSWAWGQACTPRFPSTLPEEDTQTTG